MGTVLVCLSPVSQGRRKNPLSALRAPLPGAHSCAAVAACQYIRERQRNRPICESWSRKRQARKSRREIEITLTMEKGITLILMSRKKAAPRDAADENGLFD